MTKPDSAPRIWYGIQGEGRGHATRSLTLVRALRDRGCDVHLFAGGDALDIVGDIPGLIEIPSLRFHRNGPRISLWRTFKANLAHAPELFGMHGPVSHRLDEIRQQSPPQLVISDFEPFLARWADKNRIPWMSIDHQHALTDTILPRVSPRIDLEGRFLSKMVEWLIPSRERIVSSFHHFQRSPRTTADFVGCFLREEIVQATPSDQGHVCVYLKDRALLGSVANLASARPGTRFELWTDSDIELPANAIRRQPHPIEFIQSLAGCRCLLTTAGNQLLGEALSLEKPVFAIPTPGQTEQIFNACALTESGCGDWCDSRSLTPERWDAFLDSHRARVGNIRNRNLHAEQVDGTAATVALVMNRLGSI